MLVRKKDGLVEDFDYSKIVNAYSKSERQASKKLTKEEESRIKDIVYYYIDTLEGEGVELVNTSTLHRIVMDSLLEVSPAVHAEYSSFRKYKKSMDKGFMSAYEDSTNILFSGDSENANKDSQLNSTKQSLIGLSFTKQLMRNFEMNPEWMALHDEGVLHIHDLSERYLRQFNCCLFNMSGLLDGGFELNGSKYIEPKTVQTAFAVVGDVTLSASSQQYGGFTIPEIDTVLAKYAKQSYDRHLYTITEEMFGPLEELEFEQSGYLESIKKLAHHYTMREIEQGYQGFETKLNTVSNSLGQVPFVTVTFGLDTSYWGRKISETILKVRTEGMGANKATAIFPKLVFLSRKEINREPTSPNFELYQLAVNCSSTRLYPDYLSLDSGHLGEVYDRTGLAVSPMGCRAYLSPGEDRYGKEVYTGRNNIGAVSLNLPLIALKVQKNWLDKNHTMNQTGLVHNLKEEIEKLSIKVFDIHKDYLEKISSMKGSSNPLYFCEGGAWDKVGYNEKVEKIYKNSTASLGYVGLDEALNAMLVSEGDKQRFGLEIVEHMKSLTEKASKEYEMNFALYSTPAESLCYRFQKINQKAFGIIDGITDKEYMTNSFHVPVWKDLTVPEKINFEAPFHQVATGGKISYNEFVNGVDNSVLMQAINFAMDKGLYYGVNVVSSNCDKCGKSGDFKKCPSCGNEDITIVTRVCGYLSFGQVKGNSRYNPGKIKEIEDRVKHSL